MKASSYPVLKDRPIDQWKVTELKEELKRRKLTTKGLKEELVRRLDESLRDEMETAVEGDAVNGNGEDDSQLKDQDEEKTLVVDESASKDDEVGKGDMITENVEENTDVKVTQDDDPSVQVIDNADVKNADQNSAQQVDDSSAVKDESKSRADTPSVEISIAASDDVLSKAALAVEVSKKEQIETEKSDSKIQDIEPTVVEISADSGNLPFEAASAVDLKEPIGMVKSESTAQPTAEDIKPLGESVTDAPSVEINIAASEKVLSEAAPAIEVSVKEQIATDKSDSRTEPAEDIKPPDEEVKHVMSDLNHQVSEVSPSLGFPVKHDSISDDSMTNNEKNELKDNIIADDVKLEPDVKHEIVQPSSSPVAPDAGKSHPMDVEEPQSKHSDDETNKTVVNVDVSKKNSSADLGSPEKLNLDRSSGDDSMEEDTLESKQVDSTCNSDEVGVGGEKIDVTLSKEESLVDVVGNDSASKKDSHVDDMVVAASADKRKLPEQETIANNEPSKRQRRWKTETTKVSEPQSSISPLSTTPKGTPLAAGLKRNFSRSNSDAAGDDAPKERVVPPPLKAPTDSLRIDNFLRPFTLKAVQELLGKTGTVTNFWMDHIKTHCYVTYSSLEEAVATRDAVYNLQWPPNGGRNLAAEFVDAQEVKSHVEGPTQPAPAPPAAAPLAEPVAVPPQPSPRQLGLRQKMPPPANLPPPPPLANPPPVRERLQPPPPPPPLEKVEPPALTLDDLFKKTKATPRIYYLPLSEEQVKAKMEVQTKQQ